MKFDTPEGFMPVSDAARAINVTVQTLIGLIHRNKIPAQAMYSPRCRHWFISQETYHTLLQHGIEFFKIQNAPQAPVKSFWIKTAPDLSGIPLTIDQQDAHDFLMSHPDMIECQRGIRMLVSGCKMSQKYNQHYMTDDTAWEPDQEVLKAQWLPCVGCEHYAPHSKKYFSIGQRGTPRKKEQDRILREAKVKGYREGSHTRLDPLTDQDRRIMAGLAARRAEIQKAKMDGKYKAAERRLQAT